MAIELAVLGSCPGQLSGITLETLADLVDQMKILPSVFTVPVFHRFTPGMYIREVHVPAGTAIVTMLHKTEHPFVVSKGKILVYALNGVVQCIEAPFMGITKPGTIRLAVAITDVVWTTFHATTETDVEKLEQELVLSPRQALEHEELKCLS